ncbi:sulfotransferase family protein [Pseudoalteromonas sp. MMG010]|uniref:sulfotransferase n=1 Tax=Pseudoalteromonas sp. MMG010 TaxID=2822685 RepID=UPI001B3A0DB0|nr:sulfotransferase [Pseudoalteromonas sp. MMG010]MBQ4832430.1 sulfotransferase family protein [Pseudoalteromonas sp. MMG010]
MNQDNKIFVIGLPRTGTTSVCNALLNLNIFTAHTAYTEKCFAQAQALADTPIFNDFIYLDTLYPHSKFIYLERDLSKWLPSIRQLLLRMHTNLTRSDGGFNIHIKRCFLNTFDNLTLSNINSDDYLTDCYKKHISNVKAYFINRPDDILFIDIANDKSYRDFCQFLNVEQTLSNDFQLLNAGGKVTAWNSIKHEFKIDSTAKGKIDKHIYPDTI